MRENFDRCLKEVLKHEGGYANDPRDAGGETMYGITIAVARAHGYTGPMRNIPMGLVANIYKRSYWDKVGGDNLGAGIDLATFDYAVNSGVSRAREYLAVAAAKGGSHGDIINRLCDARLAFMKRAKNSKTGAPLWPTYGKGWSRRVAEVRAAALALAAGKPSAAKQAGKVIASGAGVAIPAATVGAPWYVFVGIAVAVAVVVGFVLWKRSKG